MINLLNIIATLFTSTVYHVPEGYSKAQIDIGYDFVADEYNYNGFDYLLFEFELIPIVDLTSSYFESGTSLNNELLNSLLFEYELANHYLSDVGSVVFDINIFDIYITCFNEPISTINFYFDYTLDITVLYNDNTSNYDYYEGYYEFDFYPNFTILSTFDFIDEAYLYRFNASCNVDLGYTAGYNEGYSVGYDDGVEFGFQDGYEAGSNDLGNVFNGSWVEWLGNAVTGFFSLEIFPGFSLAGALGAVLCAYIMMWILKVLAGG